MKSLVLLFCSNLAACLINLRCVSVLQFAHWSKNIKLFQTHLIHYLLFFPKYYQVKLHCTLWPMHWLFVAKIPIMRQNKGASGEDDYVVLSLLERKIPSNIIQIWYIFLQGNTSKIHPVPLPVDEFVFLLFFSDVQPLTFDEHTRKQATIESSRSNTYSDCFQKTRLVFKKGLINNILN